MEIQDAEEGQVLRNITRIFQEIWTNFEHCWIRASAI